MNMDELEQKYLLQYKYSLPLRQQLNAVIKSFPLSGRAAKTFLDVGMPNPIMSKELRRAGGSWSTVVRSPKLLEITSKILEDQNVTCLGVNGELPYLDQSFDYMIVALDILPAMSSTEKFLKECHRILKPNGRLIIAIQTKRPLSLITVLRNKLAKRINGFTPINIALSQRDIFHLFNAGYNVIACENYSKFFTEIARIKEYELSITNCATKKKAPSYWWANQLDFFLIGAKGHISVITAERKQWRERISPVLADGRSMQEAVLSQRL
ncbi:MAG: class I SAM-dependent methyltransferase [Kiritimatiellae bacterium]|nr:class I SAM-dependent methyltransferase [Kiritimatiellia bacterium]